MKKMKLSILFPALLMVLLQGCMEWDYGTDTDFSFRPSAGRTLFIANEGNYQYGNASLSCYDLPSRTCENEVFFRANSQKLGDVAQSLVLHDGTLWITVNNSKVIFAVDPVTFREKGRITGFTSPRHMHFVSESKAYVTQLWDSRIAIVDPRMFRITGYIETGMDPSTASTEEMVQIGNQVFTNCWSYQKRVLRIDSATDRITGSVDAGIQPAFLETDRNGKLWVLTDGGYEGNPIGREPARLSRINPDNLKIEKSFTFYGDRAPSALEATPDRDSLYFIYDGIWKMSVEAEELPRDPVIAKGGRNYYSMTVCPWNSEIYAADAIDWEQKGIVYRFTPDGKQTDQFRAGISPGAFCWF